MELNIKKEKMNNNRYYFNCTCNNYCSFAYISRNINCNANRREWNTYTSTES